jgi:L-amino acid N-acyltransferase YncA
MGVSSELALTFRRALILDAAAICEIYNQAISKATPRSSLRTESERRKWIEQHDATQYVAVREGKESKEVIVGWASISSYRPRSPVGRRRSLT